MNVTCAQYLVPLFACYLTPVGHPNRKPQEVLVGGSGPFRHHLPQRTIFDKSAAPMFDSRRGLHLGTTVSGKVIESSSDEMEVAAGFEPAYTDLQSTA